MTFFTSVNYAYVINTTGTIITDLANKEFKLKNKQFVLWKYLKERNIKPSLITEIMRKLSQMDLKEK